MGGRPGTTAPKSRWSRGLTWVRPGLPGRSDGDWPGPKSSPSSPVFPASSNLAANLRALRIHPWHKPYLNRGYRCRYREDGVEKEEGARAGTASSPAACHVTAERPPRPLTFVPP